jgi:cytochrome c oxidase subunit 3
MTQSTEEVHDDDDARTSSPSDPSDPGHESEGDGHGHDAHGHDHEHAAHPFLQHHFDTPQQQFDAGKLGIWLFLVTEVLFFAGLFCAYTVYRAQNPQMFNYAHYFLNTTMGAINTVVLLVSSLTAAWAVRNAQLGQRTLLIVNILITIGCACTFMCVKYFEYSHKVHDGLLWGRHFNPKEEAWELEYFKHKHPEAFELAEKLRELEKAAPAPVAAAPAPAETVAPTTEASAAPARPAAPPPEAGAAAAAHPPEEAAPKDAPRAIEPPQPGMAKAPEQRAAAEKINAARAGPGAEAQATAKKHTGQTVPEGSNADPSALDAEQKAAPAETAAAPTEAAGTPAAEAPAPTAGAVAAAAAGAPEHSAAAEAMELVSKASPAALKPLVDAGIIGEPSRGVTTVGRPRNTHIFFGIYFFMTGLHGFHVLCGIGVWIWMLVRAVKGHFGASYFGPIDYAALYWHLVDLIWIYLFPLLYLIH